MLVKRNSALELIRENTMKTYHIYRLINTADGNKSYIGLTSQKDPSKRWNKCQYRGRLIKMAIEKFGWENFKHEILAETTHIHAANKLEQDFIKQFDTLNPDHGYNSQKGGTYLRRGYRRSIEATVKQSLTMSKKRWFFNPDTSESVRLLPNEQIPAGFVPGRGSYKSSAA